MEPKQSWWANRGGIERRDDRRHEVLQKTTRTRRRMPSTNGQANQWRERNWLPERNPLHHQNGELCLPRVMPSLLTSVSEDHEVLPNPMRARASQGTVMNQMLQRGFKVLRVVVSRPAILIYLSSFSRMRMWALRRILCYCWTFRIFSSRIVDLARRTAQIACVNAEDEPV